MSHFYRLVFVCAVLFSGFSLCAQVDDEDIDWNKELLRRVKLEHPVYKPIIGVGAGFMSFHGEVNSDNVSDLVVGQQGFNVDIMRTINPFYTFGFRFCYGTLQGEKFTTEPNEHFNFQTQMMTFGVNLQYNFSHINFIGQNEDRKLTPFVQVGLEFMNYETLGDMMKGDANYHYWSDGSIHLVEELPENSLSPAIPRDYDYETSLTEENYVEAPPSSMNIGIPIDIGLTLKMSPKASLRLGYSYHLAFTDMIDNIGTQGEKFDDYPERKGQSGGDNYSYTYISFNLDLFSRTTEQQQLQFLELDAGGIYDFWDMDGDFVMDEYDECPFTPAGVPVDSLGCPFDTDDDGVPDYKDIEEGTSKSAFLVDTDGKEVKEDVLLENLNDKDSFDQSEIYSYYPSLLQGTGLYRQFYKEIPEKFMSVDADNDGYISVEEYFKTIDNFFDSSDLTVDDLQELNEFFFMQ